MKKVVIHVVPLNDVKAHRERDCGECWCAPRVERHGDGVVVIHNSADGRELVEQHGVN